MPKNQFRRVLAKNLRAAPLSADFVRSSILAASFFPALLSYHIPPVASRLPTGWILCAPECAAWSRFIPGCRTWHSWTITRMAFSTRSTAVVPYEIREMQAANMLCLADLFSRHVDFIYCNACEFDGCPAPFSLSERITFCIRDWSRCTPYLRTFGPSSELLGPKELQIQELLLFFTGRGRAVGFASKYYRNTRQHES